MGTTAVSGSADETDFCFRKEIASFRRYGSDKYTSKIAYQKKYKRFLFYCTYTNGRSQTSIKMYMPVSKKKASYTVYFNETVRASGKTGKISGKAILKRKTYNNRTTNKYGKKNNPLLPQFRL